MYTRLLKLRFQIELINYLAVCCRNGEGATNSPLKNLHKSSHPNLTYLEGKGKQKEEEKFCTCNERKGK
jgi:hypothetical protein